MTLFTGSAVALITPFLEDGSVDYDGLKKLIEFQIEGKTDALLICGTTGESATMSDEEHIDVIRFAVEQVNGRVPVIAGAGSNNTLHGRQLSVASEKAGADALLLVTPYYNKTSQRGLYEHFKFQCEAVDIPVILYNVPGRTSVHLAAETVAKLAKLPNVVGVKEASGDLGLAVKIESLCGQEIDLYSGNDDITVPILSIGGKGVISVLANVFPEDTHRMVQSFLEGNVKEAARLQIKYRRFIDALFMEPNPIPVKAVMNMLGLPAGSLRLPLVEASDATKKELREALLELGVEVEG